MNEIVILIVMLNCNMWVHGYVMIRYLIIKNINMKQMNNEVKDWKKVVIFITVFLIDYYNYFVINMVNI